MQKEKQDVLRIRRRGEDQYRALTVRLPEAMLRQLERIAGETNCFRNQIITLLIEYGIDRIEILPP